MLTETVSDTSQPSRRDYVLAIALAVMMALTIWSHVKPRRCVSVEIPQIVQGENDD